MFISILETMLTCKYSGLLFECPYKDELDTCPYKQFRELSLKDRIIIYEKLSSKSRLTLVESHLNCAKNR